MQALALICVVIAVLGMAAYSVFRKWLLNTKLFSERELLVAQCAVAALMSCAWRVVAGPWWNTLAPESADQLIWWAALAATTIANIVIQFANMRSVRLADASYVTPISAMTPGLVIVSALMIGEHPTSIALIGIAIVVCATYGHIREGTPWGIEYFTPIFFWLTFRSTRSLPETEAHKIQALRWAYLAAVCAVPGLIGDGLVARHGDMILAVSIELGILAIVYQLFLPPLAAGEKLHKGTRRWYHFALLGGCFAVPFILLGVSFRLAPIADVGSLKRVAIPLTAYGAYKLLGEKSGRRRTIFASIIAAGAILISFDPAPAVVINSAENWLRTFIH